MLKFHCSIYEGCGGNDAWEQVRRILEDRWNIKFSERQLTIVTKYFTYDNSPTSVALRKHNLTIYHENKNKNNPAFD